VIAAQPHREATMLCLRTLGALDLRDDANRELRSLLVQPKRFALLAYLTIAGRGAFVRRDVLRALFWPELDWHHARRALNQAVHVLRGAVGHDVVLTRGGEDIRVDDARLWCDAIALQQRLAAGDLAGALTLYRGNLLQGLFVTGLREFERWLEETRACLRSRATAAALRLSEAAEWQGDGATAMLWARWGVALAPTEESAARHLVAVLGRLGDRAAAVRAYADFAELIAREYDLDPSAETRALVDAIRRNAPLPAPRRSSAAMTDVGAPMPSTRVPSTRASAAREPSGDEPPRADFIAVLDSPLA
jgi:DNA-binding SARP family transcriptional activator